ncbi:hypothetical protein ABZ901_15940 [Actinacidiphila alni]|uniref:hypothetical protein n=1 Tax=Actinacidiphila alni TaxID=380248 RepID=UPI0033CBBDEA
MRTVFVFPAGERAATVASLNRHLPEQRNPWTLDGNLCIDIDDEQTGYLFSDWDRAQVMGVPGAEQRKQGGFITGFYNRNGMYTGDLYLVKVINVHLPHGS